MNEQNILNHISRQVKQTASYKQLARELGAHGTRERRELAHYLRRLVKSGALVESERDRFAIPPKPKKSSANLVSGRLRMHPDGFGFVIADDQAIRQSMSGDIFIPPPATGPAMHGDRVLVEMRAVRADGRAGGRVVQVVGREHATVVGIFHYGTRNNYVTPLDEKISQEIMIPRGAERPLKTAEAAEDAEEIQKKKKTTTKGTKEYTKDQTERHRVIGEEARRRTEFGDLDGVVVDVEITDWPTPTQNARGRVIEILGYEDDFGVDVEIIIRKHHLPHRFPPEVMEEAQSASAVVAAREMRARQDFRSFPIVTIDGETARDFDDAVTVRRMENGNYELQVHIADVAHYVTTDSRLDQEARLRGTSVYFPDRSVPMLPLELSTDICSLKPKVDRLVLSCIMEIDHQGEIVCYELCPGAIRSAERMTYTGVNAVLEGDAGMRKHYADLTGLFELMRDLAMILNRQRDRRGSIDFDLR